MNWTKLLVAQTVLALQISRDYMPKITYDEVKENVEKSGWQLLSTTYVNLKTDLELMCPEGHNVFINYEKWRKKNYECPICKQNQYYHISTNAVEKNGFRILAFD